MIEGCITALVTPFAGDQLDERAFADFVAWQVEQGTDGLVPCWAAGEGPTLTPGERHRLIRICVEHAAGGLPVVAATGTNCTDQTITLTRDAKRAGARAALLVMPYYNRPAQEGLYRHVEAVARAVDLPLVLHDCPARTGLQLHGATIERLARLRAVVGLCGSSRDITNFFGGRDHDGGGLVRLCGQDIEAVGFNLAGGQGCLSTLANVLPGLCAALQRACRTGAYEQAAQLHGRALPLIVALERESEPVGIKQAVAMSGPASRRPTACPSSSRRPRRGAASRRRCAT